VLDGSCGNGAIFLLPAELHLTGIDLEPKPMSHFPFRSSACREQYHARYAQRAVAWPVPCETRLIETPAGWTHVRLSGSREAPLLLLLHGARGNSLMWVPNIAALSAGLNTCAIDTIGETGLSVCRNRLSRTEQLLAWLEEVIGVLAPGQPVSLAGLSYGGYLASQFALRFPGRIRRLVLLSPAATVMPVSAAMLGRAMLTVLPHIAFRRSFYHWLLADSVRSGPEGRVWVDEAVDDWALADRCFAYLHLVGAAVLDDDTLRQWRTPTLYLVGENERMYSPHHALARLRRLAPQIKTGLIPGAGHDLWWVRAETVNKAMVEFLTSSE
jgi:pimeloyl-ACP methyl ester carboxylesterase